MKRNIIFGSAVLLAVVCFCVFSFQGNAQKVPAQNVPRDVGIILMDDVWYQRQKDRTTKLVTLLKGQTLDETFVGLLNDQQYYYPGYHTNARMGPSDMETMLSARGFLKVLQQFEKLPREQARAKLDEFCKRAIKEYEFALKVCQLRYEQPEFVPPSTESPSILGAKYMICTTMLLAAKVDQYSVVVRQVEEMNRVAATHLGYIAPNSDLPDASGLMQPSIGTSQRIALLEDDCMFTVLMYAAKRAKINVKDISLEGTKRKSIPLYRWDAEACHYDFLVEQGHLKPDPKNMLEQFDVYEFARNYADKRSIVNKLVECLKK